MAISKSICDAMLINCAVALSKDLIHVLYHKEHCTLAFAFCWFFVVVVVVFNFSGALTAKYRHFRGEVPQPQDKEEVYQVHELAVIMQCAYMHTYLIQC